MKCECTTTSFKAAQYILLGLIVIICIALIGWVLGRSPDARTTTPANVIHVTQGE